MLIHHLNCISECPLGGIFMDGVSGARLRGRLTSHCLLIETDHHLVLVDTGFGLRDVRAPRARLDDLFLFVHRPRFREQLTAIRQIERMGFDPRDVRHIVLTHLDCDHAGGLDDLPWATVHVLDSEVAAAEARSSRIDRMRYRLSQWHTRPNWKTYRCSDDERWLGLPCVRPLDGLTDQIVLVPLVGHTAGHCGVAVRREDGGWLLHAGDAYFFRGELESPRARCPIGLRAMQMLMDTNRKARLETQQQLRELVRGRDPALKIICSHDAREFEESAGRRCESLPPLVRMTRDGRPIVDEGAVDAAPPALRGMASLRPVVRPARDKREPHASF